MLHTNYTMISLQIFCIVICIGNIYFTRQANFWAAKMQEKYLSEAKTEEEKERIKQSKKYKGLIRGTMSINTGCILMSGGFFLMVIALALLQQGA